MKRVYTVLVFFVFVALGFAATLNLTNDVVMVDVPSLASEAVPKSYADGTTNGLVANSFLFNGYNASNFAGRIICTDGTLSIVSAAPISGNPNNYALSAWDLSNNVVVWALARVNEASNGVTAWVTAQGYGTGTGDVSKTYVDAQDVANSNGTITQVGGSNFWVRAQGTNWVDQNFYPRNNPSNWVTEDVTGGLYQASNPSGYSTGDVSKAYVDGKYATGPTRTNCLVTWLLNDPTNGTSYATQPAWLAEQEYTCLWVDGVVVGGGVWTGNVEQTVGTNFASTTVLATNLGFSSLFSSNGVSVFQNQTWSNGNAIILKTTFQSATQLWLRVGGYAPLW